MQWVLQTVSVKDGKEQDLHEFESTARAVRWMPDGSGVLVVHQNLEALSGGQISFVSYPGGAVSHFTNDLTNYDTCCLDISRDGESVVALADSVVSDVWVARPDGSEAKQVTSGEPLGLGLGWSGERIVAGNGRGQWFFIHADGSGRTALNAANDPKFSLSTCADGKYVVYTEVRNGNLEIWRSLADGSNPLRLVAEGALSGGGCMPDSKNVVYGLKSGIWLIPIDGGTPKKLDVPLSQIGFSRDEKLEFNTAEDMTENPPATMLYIKETSNGAPVARYPVPYGAGNIKFSPDGKAITYLATRNRAANIWKQKISGGEAMQVTKFTSGDIFGYSWSNDGKVLALARGELKSDAVMMSNFR